jgi:ribosomal protein S18 acetylase RimI-like enzyme
VRAEIVAIYDAALEVENGARWASEWLPVHATRSDFTFLVAREDDAVVGFAYGYTGAYGQWWTDSVAKVLDPEQRAEWLDAPHFEVVELHVRPDRHRRGIGTCLLQELLARQPHDRALLTARENSAQARSFYARNGWEELTPIEWEEGYPCSIVLGKRVA